MSPKGDLDLAMSNEFLLSILSTRALRSVFCTLFLQVTTCHNLSEKLIESRTRD